MYIYIKEYKYLYPWLYIYKLLIVLITNFFIYFIYLFNLFFIT